MELNFYSLSPIVGVAGVLAVAGYTVWQKKKVLDDERRRRTLNYLRAALLD